MRKPAPLHEAVEAALPRRTLAVRRAVLIEAIVDRAETWRRAQPEVERQAARVRARVKVSDALARAVEKSLAKLRAIDAQPDALDARLYARCEAVLAELRRWDKYNRPARRRPETPNAALVRWVTDLCRRQAGLTRDETAGVLDAIGDRLGVTLTAATLRRRAERARKR